MRLGTNSSDEFMQLLNQKNKEIQQIYIQSISNLTQTADVKVMLGDSTVTEQKTFDPGKVSNFFQSVANSLKGWSVHGVSVTNNEDIRRIFLKFEKMAGNYLLSGHMSIQFHVLLYYKPDQRVIDCQKELSSLVDLTKDKEQQISDSGDQFVLSKLREMGHRNLDIQALFEIFYSDDKFREKLYGEIVGDADADFQSLSEKKARLFDELDSLLLETYQVTPVLIDDARLVTGEVGCLLTLDIEHVKNRSKHGTFDPRKIPQDARSAIVEDLGSILAILDGSHAPGSDSSVALD